MQYYFGDHFIMWGFDKNFLWPPNDAYSVTEFQFYAVHLWLID